MDVVGEWSGAGAEAVRSPVLSKVQQGEGAEGTPERGGCSSRARGVPGAPHPHPAVPGAPGGPGGGPGGVRRVEAPGVLAGGGSRPGGRGVRAVRVWLARARPRLACDPGGGDSGSPGGGPGVVVGAGPAGYVWSRGLAAVPGRGARGGVLAGTVLRDEEAAERVARVGRRPAARGLPGRSGAALGGVVRGELEKRFSSSAGRSTSRVGDPGVGSGRGGASGCPRAISPGMRTIKLSDGKYEFDLQDGRLVAARRHGERWPAGLDLRFSGCFIAALIRIAELESTSPP